MGMAHTGQAATPAGVAQLVGRIDRLPRARPQYSRTPRFSASHSSLLVAAGRANPRTSGALDEGVTAAVVVAGVTMVASSTSLTPPSPTPRLAPFPIGRARTFIIASLVRSSSNAHRGRRLARHYRGGRRPPSVPICDARGRARRERARPRRSSSVPRRGAASAPSPDDLAAARVHESPRPPAVSTRPKNCVTWRSTTSPRERNP